MEIKRLEIKNYDDYKELVVKNLTIIKEGLLELTKISDEEFRVLSLNYNQVIKLDISDVNKLYLKYFDYDTDEYHYADEVTDFITEMKDILEYKDLSEREAEALTLIKCSLDNKQLSTGLLLKHIRSFESYLYRGACNNCRGIAYWVSIMISFPAEFEIHNLINSIPDDFIVAMISKAKETNDMLKEHKVRFKQATLYKETEQNTLILNFNLGESEYWRLEKREVFDKSKSVRARDHQISNDFYKSGGHIHKVALTRNNDNSYRRWRTDYDYYGYHTHDWD